MYVDPAVFNSHLDERDRATVTAYSAARQALTHLLVGDVVQFADGVTRRASYIWPESVQTSSGGSFHLFSSGNMSFSGSLYTSVPVETLTATEETRTGEAWIWHHGITGAGMGRTCIVPLRVWSCSLPAPH